MKILYAIQGTGNGHLSRARDIVPVLMKNHDVEILVSGSQSEVDFPYPVKYQLKGLGFIFGAKGGIDIIETYKKNYIKVLLSEINSLPVQDYDMVINDFEPVSAWACHLSNVHCVSVSHQSAVLNRQSPRPKSKDLLAKAILKNYAPAKAKYGFHFRAYDDNIFTPVIRSQIREMKVENLGHYTVYLPAYHDNRILKVLRLCPGVEWQVFSKHNKQAYTENNISIQPINNEAFIKSMASAEGVLCGAGFETPSESLYMGKKLMVIPMKGQFEQLCNAAALKELGVPVLKTLKPENADKINDWIQNGTVETVSYPDVTEEIINMIIGKQSENIIKTNTGMQKEYTVKEFRKLLLRKLVAQF
ncbi:MAG: glycosyltransferase-distantly-like [Bacteroidetes bacterium]|nr:MAG: glycosyltransferase-distantly-like [Bacteroidota bacterium]